jgi:hypothetical protein
MESPKAPTSDGVAVIFSPNALWTTRSTQARCRQGPQTPAHGRGCGVGRTLGGGIGRGVGVGRIVAVGVAVGGGVAVAVAEGVGVGVPPPPSLAPGFQPSLGPGFKIPHCRIGGLRRRVGVEPEVIQRAKANRIGVLIGCKSFRLQVIEVVCWSTSQGVLL